jgi:hypothetical protein
MHKYAAVLAATEPFKESCQRHVLQSVGALKRLSLWIKGITMCTEYMPNMPDAYNWVLAIQAAQY